LTEWQGGIIVVVMMRATIHIPLAGITNGMKAAGVEHETAPDFHRTYKNMEKFL
jgi:hypothetical protein